MEAKQQTKMVVIVHRPDGTVQVKSFVRDTPLPEDFVMKDSIPVTSKTFPTMVKRLAFFFEKLYFKTNA